MPLTLGKGRVLREGTTIAILSYGTRLQECLAAAETLGGMGLSTTVADARFAKPLDTDLVEQLARNHAVVLTVEEGAEGGFGSIVLHHLARSGLLDQGLKIRPLTLPDRFQDHEKPELQYAEAALSAQHIVATAAAALGLDAPVTGVVRA